MSGIVSAIGGLWPLWRVSRGEPGTIVHGFAAGTLLGAALLLMLSEAAITLHGAVGVPVLVGFLSLYLLDRVLLGVELGHGEGHAEAGHAHHLGMLTFVGFAVHSVAEGFALGFTTSTRPETTLAIGAGLALHEFPARFVLARLLVASGMSRARVAGIVIGLAVLFVATAFATSSLASTFPAIAAPWGLGYSAGMFIFLATSELLPREHGGKRGRFANMLAFISGIAVSYGAQLLSSGGHH